MPLYTVLGGLRNIADRLRQPSTHEVEKIRWPFRIVALSVFLFSITGSLAVLIAVVREGLDIHYVALLAFLFLWTYVFGKVGLTGYAPNYLLWTHGPKTRHQSQRSS